jgi:hypothetical protein
MKSSVNALVRCYLAVNQHIRSSWKRPNNRPKQGIALFRWVLEQRKLEQSKPLELTESQKKMIEELQRENVERGIPAVISVQLPV